MISNHRDTPFATSDATDPALWTEMFELLWVRSRRDVCSSTVFSGPQGLMNSQLWNPLIVFAKTLINSKGADTSGQRGALGSVVGPRAGL